MTNAPRHLSSGLASLGSPVALVPGARPVAALGRFWYSGTSLWPVALSAALHVVAVAGLVWTVGDVLDRPTQSTQSVSFLPPPQRPQPPATRGSGDGTLARVSLLYFWGPIAGDGVAGQREKSTRRVGVMNPGLDQPAARTVADSAASGGPVYTSFEVDNAVQISYGSTVPQYPSELLARRVQGKVTVRFVVDTSGFADAESVEILDSSNPQFEASVRSALPHMRFSPARLNGRRVRQLVEQPFRFKVNMPGPSPNDSTA